MTNDEIVLRKTAQYLGISVDEAANMAMLGTLPVFHTYAYWQELGYQVQKGEKAKFSAKIWKQGHRKDDEGQAHEIMFLKQSAFFAFDQVKKIEAA